jgi:hypothetical protein
LHRRHVGAVVVFLPGARIGAADGGQRQREAGDLRALSGR